ncbi:hypothetical protein KR059_000359, partial [Drosophila kikkawai]
ATSSPLNQVLTLRPPLCVDTKNVELVLETLDTVLKQYMTKELRSWRNSKRT